MRRKNSLMELFTYTPTIDRRKSIHRLLDTTMANKRVVITNAYGCFSGPYLTHSHRRKIGDTVLVYLCTECINDNGVSYPNQVTSMHCTDLELDQYITIEQRDGTDKEREAVFGNMTLTQIRNVLHWNGY